MGYRESLGECPAIAHVGDLGMKSAFRMIIWTFGGDMTSRHDLLEVVSVQ